MVSIKKSPDASERLSVLSNDSRYDLACACGTNDDEHRRRSKEGKWIYPVVLPNGGTTYLFKTLLSNECVNNCKYCPLRAGSDTERCSLSPGELAASFMSYYNARRVSGLFLSSAVTGSPDATMEQINRSALNLRRMRFRGYIHLKIIPGASEAAIRESLSLATAVSLNIETAGESNFRHLSTTKDYIRDIIRPIELISRLTAKGSPYAGIKQTTQFVVGASGETDKEIIGYSWKLYRELGLSRVYFSAYQRGAGSPELPGERSDLTNSDLLAREHRLYQTDWLIRKYGFRADEIPLDRDGNLSLGTDPKEMWAKSHPEFFPVYVNKDDKERLLRVPGLGHVMVEKILSLRKNGSSIRSIENLGRRSKLLVKAGQYLTF
ncbi:MAG: radical SAM protein [Candidatus Omnitrophica bacterium]|nr:radical SAM protein [Candidatus Omnitrophota bacterium]MDD5311258.1 radical SAM protein [Candidatus Omnitrophota bacterium]MDD5546961.1 radical SAM protein [Candidatus Omnitrophota bacterium]